MNIKIEQFKKVISGNLILDDISLEFSSGHIYGLIGKNVPRYEQKTLSIT